MDDGDESLLAGGNDDTITPSGFPRATGAGQLFNLSADASNGVSQLEQDVLDEYTRLLKNMNELNSVLSNLSSGPITLEIAESLRLLERKVASVYTLMKASVYSIVLQQGQVEGDTTRMDTMSGDGEATQTTLPMR